MALQDCTSCQYDANIMYTVAHHEYGRRARTTSGVKFLYDERSRRLSLRGLHVLDRKHVECTHSEVCNSRIRDSQRKKEPKRRTDKKNGTKTVAVFQPSVWPDVIAKIKRMRAALHFS